MDIGEKFITTHTTYLYKNLITITRNKSEKDTCDE